MNASLSPTTRRAATCGLKLNNPNLDRGASASASLAANADANGVTSESTVGPNPNLAADGERNDGSSSGRQRQITHRLIPNRNSHHGKENLDNDGDRVATTAAVFEQQPVPSKPGNINRRRRGLIRNGATTGSAMGGVRMCYFDEENVMHGADVAYSNNTTNTTTSRNGDYADGYEQENEEDDDVCSEASGDTVVHNDCPPPPANATKEEMNRHYWEWCYGNGPATMTMTVDRATSSVMRSAPAKSW